MDEALIVQKHEALCELPQRAQELLGGNARELRGRCKHALRRLGLRVAAGGQRLRSHSRFGGIDRLAKGQGAIVCGQPREGGVMAPGAAMVGDKITALHKLHREKPLVRFGQELIERDQVAVGQSAQRAKFLFEPVDIIRTRPAQHLEGDERVELAVERLIDRPKAAGPQAPAHLKAGIAGKGQGLGHSGSSDMKRSAMTAARLPACLRAAREVQEGRLDRIHCQAVAQAANFGHLGQRRAAGSFGGPRLLL